MRKSTKEITDMAVIEDILHKSHLVQLALHAEPAPYVVTLNFGYNDNTLYMHGATEGRKMELMRANPNVGFTVVGSYTIVSDDEDASKWTAHYASVTGHGVVEIVEEKEEKRMCLNRLMLDYTDEVYDYSDKLLNATAVFKLKITAMTGKQNPPPK